MHPPRRSSSPTSAERMAEAYAQLELNRAHTSYLDTLQNALLTAVRMQHDQAHQQPPAQSAAPPTVQQQPISLATLPMAMAPAMPVSADAAMPAAPSTDEDASTHLLEVCTRKLSALQAQAKVTGWTEELKRRKAVLLPLMTQLLESEDALPAPSPAPTRSIEQATPAAYVQGPLLLTGTPPSALSDLIPGRPLPTTTAGMAGPSTAAASPPSLLSPAHLVHLPPMATKESAALAAQLHDTPMRTAAAPPFDVQTLAASLSAVLNAPLASGSISVPQHTSTVTTKQRASGRSSSSNTSQGGSLGTISSLSKGSSGLRGGSRLDPELVSLKFLEEQGMLVLSEHGAAAKLGVGVNTLKRHCRRLGLQRWPGRKLRAKARRGEAVAMEDASPRQSGGSLGRSASLDGSLAAEATRVLVQPAPVGRAAADTEQRLQELAGVAMGWGMANNE